MSENPHSKPARSANWLIYLLAIAAGGLWIFQNCTPPGDQTAADGQTAHVQADMLGERLELLLQVQDAKGNSRTYVKLDSGFRATPPRVDIFDATGNRVGQVQMSAG